MGNIIETLKKVQYTSLTQFVEDINRNFAIIQNSPLYKGIPGETGDPGIQGPMGTRGSRFFFLKNKINDILTLQQKPNFNVGDITIDFINQKYIEDISLFYTLFPEIRDTGFVSNDIIVMPNSVMIQFDKLNNKFVQTGMSFNENHTFLSSIESKIDNYIKHHIDNNPQVLALQNIFERYATYGKNYASTSHITISNQLTNGTVFTPLLGNNTSGIKIQNHKYFGFSDSEFPVSNSGTIVFGSMCNFTKMVEQTITSTGQNSTASAKYAIGVNNIPTAIFMQDTGRAGIMIGYKNWKNLRNFGSIYKEIKGSEFDGPLVIKSNMGDLEHEPNIEYSKLSLFKTHLTYDKFAKFLDNLEIKKDLIFGQNINSKFIRSGEYVSKEIPNKNKVMEFGYWNGTTEYDGLLKNQFKHIVYEHYPSNVLVTDNSGKLRNDYRIETKPFTDIITSTNLQQIGWISNAPTTSIPTSDYLTKIIQKINALQTYISNNYWRKLDWYNEQKDYERFIPALGVKNLIVTDGRSDTKFHVFGTHEEEDNYIYADYEKLLLGNQYIPTKLDSRIIELPQFKPNTVLTLDEHGAIDDLHQKETRIIEDGMPLSDIIASYKQNNRYITSYHFGKLASYINGINTHVSGDYWSKAAFNTGEIPRLHVSNELKVGNTGHLIISRDLISLASTYITSFSEKLRVEATEIDLLGEIKPITPGEENIYENKIPHTDAEGILRFDYENLTDSLPVNYWESITITNPEKKLLDGTHLNWIFNLTKQLHDTVINDYWSKSEFEDYAIPKLYLSEKLNVEGDIYTPICNISLTNNRIELGRQSTNSQTVFVTNNIQFKQKKKVTVLGTDANGNLVDNEKSLVTNINTDVPRDVNDTITQIELSTEQKQDNQIITGIQFDLITRMFNSIKKRFKNTFNKKETIDSIYKHVPVGTIVMWTAASARAYNNTRQIPPGWAICDGTMIPNTNIQTPDMRDMFVRGTDDVATAGEIGGNDTVILKQANIPEFEHSHSINYAGNHVHSVSKVIDMFSKVHRTHKVNYTEAPDNMRVSQASVCLHDNSKGFSVKSNSESDGGDNNDFWCLDNTSWFSLSSVLESMHINCNYDGSHSHNMSPAKIGIANPKPIDIKPKYYKVLYIMKFDDRIENGTDYNTDYKLVDF